MPRQDASQTNNIYTDYGGSRSFSDSSSNFLAGLKSMKAGRDVTVGDQYGLAAIFRGFRSSSPARYRLSAEVV